QHARDPDRLARVVFFGAEERADAVDAVCHRTVATVEVRRVWIAAAAAEVQRDLVPRVTVDVLPEIILRHALVDPRDVTLAVGVVRSPISGVHEHAAERDAREAVILVHEPRRVVRELSIKVGVGAIDASDGAVAVLARLAVARDPRLVPGLAALALPGLPIG